MASLLTSHATLSQKTLSALSACSRATDGHQCTTACIFPQPQALGTAHAAVHVTAPGPGASTHCFAPMVSGAGWFAWSQSANPIGKPRLLDSSSTPDEYCHDVGREVAMVHSLGVAPDAATLAGILSWIYRSELRHMWVLW